MLIDLKDFFLQSHLEEPEYIRIHGKYFVGNIRQKYKIDEIIAPDGYDYCEDIRSMYGLKQAAKLAQGQLIKYSNHSVIIQLLNPKIFGHTLLEKQNFVCV